MADAQILRTDVHVDREGTPVLLPAGGSVPAWAKDLVTNPKAFVSAEESEGEEPAGDDETGEKPYSKRSNEELVALLKERELPHSGNKSDLVARLEQADKEAAEESEGEEPAGDDADEKQE